jgi:hypothetical protein
MAGWAGERVADGSDCVQRGGCASPGRAVLLRGWGTVGDCQGRVLIPPLPRLLRAFTLPKVVSLCFGESTWNPAYAWYGLLQPRPNAAMVIDRR